MSPVETDTRLLSRDAEGLRLARTGDTPAGRLSLGPSTVGGLLTFEPDRAATPPGRSLGPLAPLAADAFGLADRVCGTGLGPLGYAGAVRRRSG